MDMCGNCVLVEFDFESGDPVFGKILSFVCVGNAEWNMVVQILHTYTFYRHFHAFCIKENKPTKYKLCRIQDLADHHPLHCYSMIVNRPHELLKFKTETTLTCRGVIAAYSCELSYRLQRL